MSSPGVNPLHGPPQEGRDVLPIHVAVHHLGCARQEGGTVAVSSLMGPHYEALAERVEHLTVLAYTESAHPGYEDLTDYILRPRRGDVRFISLGPKGTWRDHLRRRREIAGNLGAVSRGFDVVLLRLPNRRVGALTSANRCSRLVVLASGHGPSVTRNTKLPWARKLVAMASASYAEHLQRRLVRRAGVAAVNSEWLRLHYSRVRPDLKLVRTSGRRAEHVFHAPDRFDRQGFNLLVAGRLSRPKGVFEALDVLQLLRDGGVSGRLHFVGSGEAEAELRAQVASSGLEAQVVFHGWISSRERLFETFREMDAILMLSHAESFPRTVWEAMAHSVLVICTPVGDLSRALENGRDALFVRPEDPASAAAAVMQLIHSPELRRRLIAKARERASEKTVEAMADDLLSLVAQRWPELAAR